MDGLKPKLRYVGDNESLQHLNALTELWSISAENIFAPRQQQDKQLKESKFTIKCRWHVTCIKPHGNNVGQLGENML